MGKRDENREKTLSAITDAAEELLRHGGNDALTAGAVAEKVGLARNSLYRYVDSMDELRGRVVMRLLPTYLDRIETAVATADTPEAKLAAYVGANLSIANHGWMMELAQGLPPEAEAQVSDIHTQLIDAMSALLAPFGPTNPRLAGELIQGIISAGFAALDHGADLEQTIDYCSRACLAIARG